MHSSAPRARVHRFWGVVLTVDSETGDSKTGDAETGDIKTSERGRETGDEVYF